MTEKRREPSDEIKRALQILDNRNAADDDERWLACFQARHLDTISRNGSSLPCARHPCRPEDAGFVRGVPPSLPVFPVR